MFECISAATLIFVVVWWPSMVLFRPLDTPLIRFYGRISYSFYLLHPLSIWLIAHTLIAQNAIGAGYSATPVAIVAALASVAIATPAAYLCWRFVEIPGIAAGRLLRQRTVAAE
jgi:peptidoglycan/LPS O-acetylase OafA/YrhL